jgi:hypothetical protein
MEACSCFVLKGIGCHQESGAEGAVNRGDEPEHIDKTQLEHDRRTRQHRHVGLILVAFLLFGLGIRLFWRAWP